MTVKEQVVNLITAAALMPGSPRMNTTTIHGFSLN